MQEQNKQVKIEQKITPKKKIDRVIDQDYLMYNSTEDEDQLRYHVQDNYSNTDTKSFNDSF